jgi:hypothetical protein
LHLLQTITARGLHSVHDYQDLLYLVFEKAIGAKLESQASSLLGLSVLEPILLVKFAVEEVDGFWAIEVSALKALLVGPVVE